MEITEEQLEALIDKKLQEKGVKPNRPFNSEWRKLKQEINDYSNNVSEKNKFAKHAWTFSEAFNVMIRFHLDIKSVTQITEEQAPEARKLFEQLKQLI